MQRTLNPLVRGSNPCRCTYCSIDQWAFPLLAINTVAENGDEAWFEVVPRPSFQPVILCLSFVEPKGGSVFFEYGDDLDSTGKLRLQTASRDSGYPVIIQCTIGANNNYALAA